jgi:hypothetical protein
MNEFFLFGIGNFTAAFLSWSRTRNPLYIFISFILGWLYVGYWAISESQNYRDY